jgi:hypothetical protein
VGGSRSPVGPLAVLSAVAGLVHLAFIPVHLEESWAYGLFLAAVAAAQLGWAALAVGRSPSRPLLAAAAAGNAGVALVWAVSRATGSEPVGLADGLCTAIELVLVGGATVLLARPAPGPLWPRWATAGAASIALGLAAVAVTPVLTGSPGGHGHDRHRDHDRAEAAAESTGAATPAPPARAHGHDIGDRPPAEAAPTPAQQAAADSLVATPGTAVARFADLDAAVAAGYRPITPPGQRIVHYGHPSYMLDARVLDPHHVESLVYARTSRGPVLLGAMYMMPPGAKGPQVAGSLTHWHAHDDLCIDEAQLAQVARLADGSCPPGSAVRVTPEMLHVWSIDYPTGPFGELTPLDALQVLVALER